ncbi:hypothetical protein GEMRC1_005986 [Eukaryota sp. GEM-RC1]
MKRRSTTKDEPVLKSDKTEDDTSSTTISTSYEEFRPLIGAHVSAAGTYSNSLKNAIEINATCFALFVKSQRTWRARDFKPSEIKEFKELATLHNFPPTSIVAHGTYLVNLASSDASLFTKSLDGLQLELQRCSALGIGYLNIHPGSTKGDQTHLKGCIQVAKAITTALENTDTFCRESDCLTSILLENTVGAGDTLVVPLKNLPQ